MKTDLKIIIIGGGIGGVTLANAIKKYGDGKCSVHIYEKEMTVSSTAFKGYTIGLNQMGRDSLREALDIEKYDRLTSELIQSGGQYVVTDRQLNPLINFSCSSYVDRDRLCGLLREGIDVHYGMKFKSYTEDNDGVSVFFEDGSCERADFLVGADGVHSVVRHQKLPLFQMEDVNVYSIQALIPNVGDDVIDLLFKQDNTLITKTLGNKRNTIMFGKVKAQADAINFGVEDIASIERIMEQNEPGNTCLVINYEWRPLVENGRVDLPTGGRQYMLNTLRRDTGNFHPLVVDLLNRVAKPEHLINDQPKPMRQALPCRWPAASRVTLIGDAINAMTATSGCGGNLAMRDAIDLGYALTDIIKNIAPLSIRMTAHEQMIVERGQQQIKLSRDCTEHMHSQELSHCSELFRNTIMRILNKLLIWGVVKIPN
ncbi:hypothetical protein PPL_03571 [Heterostelium album PN500]|uniref:FAD-binding domain-containing protein n=1 Tax=Heterostelium pallidum (strain ATCC 26659 / Pp 5 / PN500) TaxID=670386 RepID=D3B560_HETP5|nr:hypothetical protein PPL_03571 [Heterostelium album PN500]EFA83425.1 hypothetical protein PPL_03571 [Heterostelium album PN500]|eukprot:XP_020435542.1 hypothetical protein PPL_03571 [Heterostelium album PN500]